MLLLVITLCLLLIYAWLILYYRRYWFALKEYKPPATFLKPFVSVIVAARNEEGSIQKLLQALQQQTYEPHLFEVVIVDDYSTDGTAHEVEPFSGPKVTLIQPFAPKEASSKKKAIEAGVATAQGELMLITDADCVPGNRWIETVASFYADTGAAFIAAPVAYHLHNNWLAQFQTLDFITLQGITAASVQANAHTMCNGANLAYTKQAFNAVNGFEGIDAVATGDDMLLMYKIWKQHPGRVHYLKSKDAVVHTNPMLGIKAFIKQRIRWASKATVYDDWRIIAVLAFVYCLNLWFLVLLAAPFFNLQFAPLFVFYIVGKTAIEYLFVHPVAHFYHQQTLLKKFAFFQPLHIIYTVVIGLVSQWGKYEWKGRRTR